MTRWALGGALAGFAISACGPGASPNRFQGTLEAPAPRQARLALTPALDVTGLYDNTIADRVVVDDIAINVSDARLLGADPRIPTGGLKLITAEEEVYTDGGSKGGVVLPFPKYLLGDSDLSAFVRLDTTLTLEGSSVVVHARVFQTPVKGGTAGLTSAPDPDGDPADKGGGGGSGGSVGRGSSPDPDGDPAHCAPDPDGDPAMPRTHCSGHKTSSLKADSGDDARANAAATRYVKVELRGADAADLITSLAKNSTLEVVIALPASRWFTEETMARIDAALNADPKEQSNPSDPADKGGIVVGASSGNMDRAAADQMQKTDQGGDGYRLSNQSGAGRLKISR